MNLVQLRSLCEIVDSGLKMSDAAQATFHSQPSISRQLKELESELGFAIFVRRRNRVLGITPQGEKMVEIARRMLADADNIRKLSQELSGAEGGELVLATTHTQARYFLPAVIDRFIKKYPKVQLSLRQGTPDHCNELVSKGLADLALCAALNVSEGVARIHCLKLNRAVFTPPNHPLLKIKPLTLQALAKYPLITYENGYSGRSIVDKTFAEQGLKPHIVLSAVDADVCKVYVARGLGIAIFATIAYEKGQDRHLRCTDASHLFASSDLDILVRKNSYLQSFTIDLIQMLAPATTRGMIHAAINGPGATG